MRSSNNNNYRKRERDSYFISYSNYHPSYNHHYQQQEHPESKGYWISELESLGFCPGGTSELDIEELRDFVENLKQVLLEEYRAAYHHENM